MGISSDLGQYDTSEWEAIKRRVAHPADRTNIGFGVLVRNRRTGTYGIMLGGAFRSVDQRWANRVHEQQAIEA
ncbi:MAG TPA: hypothetical protein VLM89_05800 [Phycisphaerae bacterium]|nr:hypothetical protein [Phycisphaerae bacterium]